MSELGGYSRKGGEPKIHWTELSAEQQAELAVRWEFQYTAPKGGQLLRYRELPDGEWQPGPNAGMS